MAIFFFTLKCYPQVSFYQDMFLGGVTGAGYSPDYSSGGTGNFTVYIAPGSTIRQAYLLAGRYGAAPAITVTLNGTSFTFDNTNQASPTFISPFYGGASGVHAIDVTSSLSPAVTNYTLVIPNQSGPNDRYNDFYLYIAYSNNTLPQIRTAIFLNNLDFDAMMVYSLNVTNPIGSMPGCDVGISLFAGYMCSSIDGSDVTINGTGIGTTYGPDMNSGPCGGPLGSFYYQNNTLNGLSDDIPDLAMTGPDALSNAQTLIPNNSTSLTMSFAHGNGDNAIWAVVLAYGSCCSPNAGPDDTICAGSSTTLNATGGTSYVWSPATGLSNPNIANPVATPTATTTYTVSATMGGCSGTDQVIITVNSLPTANAGSDVTICNGNSTTLAATGGTSYAWSPGTGLSATNISNPVASPSSSTTYSVTVSDNAGCTATDDVLVTVTTLPNVNAGNDVSICEGASTNLSATGGTSYVWSPATGLSAANISNPVATPTATTTYSVTITDINGCSGTDEVVVTVNPNPTINFTADPLSGCSPLNVDFISTCTPNIENYNWSFGDPSSGSANTSDAANPSHLFVPSGLYDITLTVATTDGCTGTFTINDMISVAPKPVADFTPVPTSTTIDNPVINFIDNSINATTWFWDFGDPGSPDNNSGTQSPSHTYGNEGTYIIWLIVQSQGGCTDSIAKEIIINNDYTFYAPNSFTPDGDGLNDTFIPTGVHFDMDNFEMYIFDRWGEEIYKTMDLSKPWDGKVKKTALKAPIGVYVWMVIMVDNVGKSHIIYGRVSIIK